MLLRVEIAFVFCLFSPISGDFVAAPPAILEGPEPKVTYYRPMNPKSLFCKVSGHPAPTITWVKNGEIINLNHYDIRTEEGNQKLTMLNMTSNGSIHCEAHNVYGRVISNATTFIEAFLIRFGGDETAVVQAQLRRHLVIPFVQNVRSVPAGIKSWSMPTKQDEVVKTDRRIQMNDNGDLHFAHIKAEDVGEYKCNLNNRFSDSWQGMTIITVDVQDSDSDSVYKEIPPHLAFHSPMHVTALEGQDITLRCFYAGYPLPDIDWVGPSNILPSGRHHSDPSTLRIINAIPTDAGTYKCNGRNSAGQSSRDIVVFVEALPRFLSEEDAPNNKNVSDGEDVTFRCQAYGDPPPTHQWIINGHPVINYQLPRKTTLSSDGKTLTMRHLCKSCEDGGNNLMVVQCNVSNVHGHLLRSGYINVLSKTEAILTGDKPEVTLMEEDEGDMRYQCKALSDPSTPTTVYWMRLVSTPTYSLLYGYYYDNEEYEILSSEPPYITISDFGKIFIKRRKGDAKPWSKIGVRFKCLVSNGYSYDEKFVHLNIQDSPYALRRGMLNWWWLLVIMVLLLMLVIILVVCCRWYFKNRGNQYNVDAKEKLNGNDPEKELTSNGFKAYRRPDNMVYIRGSQQSLRSSGHCSEEDGSLSDYGIMDTGKFNEDGSFVGAYVATPKPGQVKGQREFVSPLTKYYT